MTEWLTGNRAKQASKWLTVVALSAYVVELGVGIFGSAHVAIYHAVPTGYVQIRTFSRYGPSTVEYVKPWIANLHHCAIAIFILCVIPLVLLWTAGKIAKGRTAQP
jgi:hypothetical protein